MKKYNILIVDDHTLFRKGFGLILSDLDYIESIEEAQNGVDFLDKLENFNPDIVFMDINMPEMDGVEATKTALKKFPKLNIISLSMFGDQHYYKQMIEAGAKGFLVKNSDVEEIEDAIKNILAGKNYISQEILNELVTSMMKKENNDYQELSVREKEVLYLICKGYSNQEIADNLFLSKRTVDKHRENLLFKTSSKNTAGLVVFAIKNNIIAL